MADWDHWGGEGTQQKKKGAKKDRDVTAEVL